MLLQINSKFKTFKSTVASGTAAIPGGVIFALDSLSLVLFALVILGIVEHLPAYTNTIIQALFITITSFLILLFSYRRFFPLAFLKLSMLFLLYVVDVSIYFI